MTYSRRLIAVNLKTLCRENGEVWPDLLLEETVLPQNNTILRGGGISSGREIYEKKY